MTNPKISRRDFLKLAGAGAATSAVLTGCGPASRYVTREPYANMPEYTYNGKSTFYATTCMECAAGCGLIVRTMQGRAIKAEGNPLHPISQGKTCARGQATLHGLYNPDRVRFPVNQKRAAVSPPSEPEMSWDEAIQIVADALQETPDEIAFLLGEAPDHLFDLVTDLTAAIGAPAPARFGALSMFETRATLQAAAEALFGQADLLHFDFGNAELIFSFGANFLETWLSPVAFTRQFANFRKGEEGRRGTLVQFESRMSQTASVADEWVPIKPGTEAHVAVALGRLIAEAQGTLPEAYSQVSAEDAADAAGVEIEILRGLAERFAKAERPIAIPGSWAMGQRNGLDNAKAILALNSVAGNIGQAGGVFLSAPAALPQPEMTASTLAQAEALVEKMNAGEVKVLFIHGVNPVFELPKSFGFEEALKNVPLVISFASFPDETALAADYIFPDQTGLESWGYQRIQTGSARTVLSGMQPVVVPLEEPLHDVRATADVLLAAAQAVGGDLAAALPFADEVAFIEDKLSVLLGQDNALIQAGDIKTFTAKFQQHGGWWGKEAATTAPDSSMIPVLELPEISAHGEGEFFLVPFVSPTLAEKGANKPWLQEAPDPTTTVMWNTWIEMNPKTAEELGIHDDDIIKVISEAGEIEASVYLYPAIRPDTIAIPFGQGHTAYGRYAEGRGVNPNDLLEAITNEAGDLVFAATKVRIEKTGQHKQIARLESRIGVYGFDDDH